MEKVNIQFDLDILFFIRKSRTISYFNSIFYKALKDYSLRHSKMHTQSYNTSTGEMCIMTILYYKHFHAKTLILGISSYWKDVLTNMSKQVKNDNSYGHKIKVTTLGLVHVLD